MIDTFDEYSADGFGWARFASDRTQRFRLGRALTDTARGLRWIDDESLARVVFVMLNPSVADAFKLDRTVARCETFAASWGADVLEVVNLFAFVSPYPGDLYTGAMAARDIGANATNDDAIRAACTRPKTRVIAAWGRHGQLNGRADSVRELLVREHVLLEALGTNDDGSPMHPLARGKRFIPYTRKPKLWP